MMFSDILTRRRIPFRHSVSSGEINVCCPFCPSEDTGFHLGINIHTGAGHCFRCNWGSRKYAIPAFVKKLDLKESGWEAPGKDKKPLVAPELPEDFEPVTRDFAGDELLSEPWEYLKSRGIPERQIRDHGVGVSLTGKYAYRIIFPVYVSKKLKGFVARDWTGNAKAKYLNSFGEKSLYNLKPPGSSGDRLVLSEGIFKCLRIEHALGCPSSAILGNQITEEQLDQLQDLGWSKILWWPDPNSPGVLGMLRSLERFTARGISAQIIYPIPKTEADELTLEKIRKFSDRRTEPGWAVQMGLRSRVAFLY